MVEGGWPIWASILAALGVGAVIGAVNGLLVVRVRIDSFIATLGMASVLAAVASWISGGVSISGFSDGFKEITRTDLHGINLSVVYMVVLAVVGWWVLEHVPVGRYLFATGGGREAARLAGVHTDRYVFGSLVVSASVAAFAGVLETSKISSGSPGIGPPFVLPAFAAAFFGATQFHRRFNVWGTVLAVFVLASGVKGLQLAGITDLWVDDLFFGLALIIAVGLTTYRRKVHGGERRWWRREEADPDGLVGRALRWGRPRTSASAENAEDWWYDPEDKEGNHLKP
jgi:ribose transport system permease protein